MSEQTALSPQSIESETALLGSVLMGGVEALEMCGQLKAVDFYRQIHNTIYRAMLDCRKEHGAIDYLLVGERLQREHNLQMIGDWAYLTGLVIAVPTWIHAGHYAKIVRDCAERRRRIAKAALETMNAYEGKDAKRARLDL